MQIETDYILENRYIYIQVVYGRTLKLFDVCRSLIHNRPSTLNLHLQLAGIVKPYEGECLLEPRDPNSDQTFVEFTKWDEVVRIKFYVKPGWLTGTDPTEGIYYSPRDEFDSRCRKFSQLDYMWKCYVMSHLIGPQCGY